MSYGLPYKGSKNKIAQWIIDSLPPADNFYDLFGGGGAITHCAMLSGKWKNFYLNDIRPGLTECFANALHGEYSKPEYTRWISRDEFNGIKGGTTHKDCYYALVWSFGNNMEDYLFAKHKEQHKKEIFEQRQQNHALFNIERVHRLGNIERIKEMHGLGSIAQTGINNLITYCERYDRIGINNNSVVYCDIPYLNKRTFKHCKKFDFESFYQWCFKISSNGSDRNIKLFISEYEMPHGFIPVAQKTKYVGCANADSRSHAVEKLFVPHVR